MKVRTSVLKGFALLALSTFAFAACDEKTEEPPVQPEVTVSVTPQSVTLQQGQTAPLVAIVNNAANTNVTWTTTTPSVATVSASGVVTAVGPGTAVITAASVQDPNKRAAAAVTVTGLPGQGPITIQVVPENPTVQRGQTVQLVSIIQGTTNQNVIYRSSATGVATVNASTGLVTAVAPGTAVITALAQADTTRRAVSVVTVTDLPPSNVQISITPTQAAVSVNGTQQFVALVSGATNTAVTYRSSTPAVATINATTGLATGVSSGTTVITAIANADTTRRATATLQVLPQAPPPSVSIQQVGPVGPNNTVAGQLSVTTNVSADVSHDVRRVEVRIDGQTVCFQTFAQPLGTTQGVATINCPINTAELDSLGNPRFPNGARTLTTVAINGAGTVVAQATYPTLNFANINTVQGTITFQRSAIGTDGFLWNAGDATVRVVPQLFTGGALSAVTVNLDVFCDGANEATRTANAANAFTVVFEDDPATAISGAGPLNNVTEDDVCFTIGQAQTTQGQPVTLTVTGTGLSAFPGGGQPNVLNPRRVDNVSPFVPNVALPPLPGEATARPYIGTGFQFTSATATSPQVQQDSATARWFVAAGDPQPGSGVDHTSVQFFAVPESEFVAFTGANTSMSAAQQDSAIVAGRTAVTGSAQLQNRSINDPYRLFVAVTDRVGNRTIVRSNSLFGVDRENPSASITSSSPVNNHINPANQNAAHVGGEHWNDGAGVTGPVVYSVVMTDTVSGFPANPIQVAIRRDIGPGSIAGRCYNVNTKATFTTPTVGLTPGSDSIAGAVSPTSPSGCRYETLNGSVFDLMGLPDGWYTVSVRVRDVAGNVSAATTRIHLIDGVAPTVQATGTRTDNTVTLSGEARDTVGLRASEMRQSFAGLPVPSAVTRGITVMPMTCSGAPGPCAGTSTIPVPNTFQSFGTMSVSGRITQRTLGATGTVWRSIQAVDGAHLPVATLYPFDGAGFMAQDMARNFNTAIAPLTQASVGDGVAGVTYFEVFQLSGSEIYNGVARQSGGTTSAGNQNAFGWGTSSNSAPPQSRTLEAVANTAIGALAPFSAIHFFRIDSKGNVHFLGTANVASQQDFPATGIREHFWNISWSASGQSAGAGAIFAVGVDAQGDAVRSNAKGIAIIGSYHTSN